MSPVTVPPSSDDPQRERTVSAGERGAAQRIPPTSRQVVAGGAAWPGRLLAASAAAWLIYASIYAFVFTLSGFSLWLAVRGAIGNALPDALLALAAVAAARRLSWPARGSGPIPAMHALLGPLLAALAAGLKTALLLADTILLRSGKGYTFDGAIFTWQVFISLLVYAAVAGAAHAQEVAHRLRDTAEAAERAETLRAHAELAALRAQLNPHFLFNVLHSVLGLVRRDPALAEQALERLGDVLRYALHVHRDGVDWTTLRNEWEFMESYLDLEQIRLGERLRISLEADPGAMERLVPSFLLQPLVENAVRHGIASRAGGGRLGVRAMLNGTTLTIQVDNDGGPTHADPEEGPGLGQRLLLDRLAALYRSRASMSFGPTDEGGYRVVLTLPIGGEALAETAEESE